ncbi:MAG: AAA family ATPase [Phycisphaeraceae bacterium]
MNSTEANNGAAQAAARTNTPQRRPPAAARELDVLIRARYPIIYVVTWEELRVQRHLEYIAASRGKSLYTWSVTAGLNRVGGGEHTGKSRSLADPVEGLDTVIEHKDPAIYLFKDLHPFLRGSGQNIAVVRKLREVAQAISDSYKTLVITAPGVELTADLEKDVTVLDYPLPEVEDFSQLLDRICCDVSASSDLSLQVEPASREKLVQAALGLTLQEAENVFAKTIVNDGALTAADVATVFSEKQQIIRKSGLLEYFESQAGLDDVGGLDGLKAWLLTRSSAFTEKARAFGLPAPKGVLLIGVQGCGKSLCAKAVSRAWDMPLLRFDIGRMFSSLVGSSEENIRRALAVAESIAPAVLWVDEIDKAFSGSESSGGTDGGTTARVMSTFLTWMSEKKRPVFVLATANDISKLPPELLRKGRLDEIFFVDLPNVDERRAIFTIHIQRRGREPQSFDLDALAAAADGFSGAEIEEAIISALYEAFYLEHELDTQLLLGGLRQTVPLSRTMNEQIAHLRGWAEGRARWASYQPVTDTPASSLRRKLEIDPAPKLEKES